MAKQPSSEPAKSTTDESLTDVNERAAAAGEAVTTAEARSGKTSTGMADVTTADVAPS